MAVCVYAPTSTGDTARRCREQADRGRMYCSTHLREALQRVATVRRLGTKRVRKQAKVRL